MEEAWGDIAGFPTYEISTLGNIRNKKTKHMLSPNISQRGYKYVCLWKDGKHVTKYIHKTMGETFLPNPENKPMVNHKNGNKLANVITNLEWSTYSENNKHAYDTGLKIISDKVRETARRMGTSDAAKQAAYNRHPNVLIVETGEIFESHIEVANLLGCKPPSVRRCLIGDQVTCMGLHLEYTYDPPTKTKKEKKIV